MTVQITLTFPDKAAAVAFLAGNASQASVPASTPAPATTQSPAPAPQTAGFSFDAASQPSATGAAAGAPALDFDRDVVPPLKDASTKFSQQQFGALMARLKASKVTDIKAKPDVWAPLLAFLKTPSNDTFNAIPAA